MIRLMQWPSTKQLLLLWLLLLGILSSYARQGFQAPHLMRALAISATDSCSADFTTNSLNNRYRTVLFSNISTTTVAAPNGEVIYEWSFGDGILSYDRNPVHSYVSNGTYNVCLVQIVRDSSTLVNYCTDTICKSVVVNYIEPQCASEYIVDTANSFNGNVIVWNSSSPNSLDTLNSVYHRWYFGDGDSSDLAFPQHTYLNEGVYEVCLTIWSYDSVNNLCTETYCDSLGADGEGNLIYKSDGNGFTINVMDPYRIGVEEFFTSTASIYPNPANDWIDIFVDKSLDKQCSWEIFDVQGKLIKSGDFLVGKRNAKTVDISSLDEGVYVVKIGGESRSSVFCYKLRVERY